MCNDKEIHRILCRVYCNDEKFSFSEEITVKLEKNGEALHIGNLHDALLDSARDLIEDRFIEIIEDALGQFEVVPCGEFDWNCIIEQIQKEARAYVTKAAKSIHVYVDEYDNNKNVIETSELDLEKGLLKSVDRWCENEMSACTSGSYIEKSLRKFAAESQWQFGLIKNGRILHDPADWPRPMQKDGIITWNDGESILQPIMWFGLPNQEPYKTWIAMPYDEENGSIWFKENAWNILGRIIGDETDDYFLIWYFPECGGQIPDIDEIKNACPVHWDENDTKDDLNNKISWYMMSMKTIV